MHIQKTYEIRCKYTEGRFVGRRVIPKNDRFRDLTVEFDCYSEDSLYPILLEYLKTTRRVRIPYIVDLQINQLIDDETYQMCLF